MPLTKEQTQAILANPSMSSQIGHLTRARIDIGIQIMGRQLPNRLWHRMTTRGIQELAKHAAPTIPTCPPPISCVRC